MTNYNIIADHFSQKRNRNWPEFEHFVEQVKPGSSALDIGCGNGRLLQLLKEKEISYVGVDKSEKLIKIARLKFADQKFILGDITRDGIWDKLEKVDYIFCLAVLHHFTTRKDREFVFRKIRDKLKAGGRVFITVWNLWQKRFWREHIRQRSMKTLRVPYKLSDGIKIVKSIDRNLYVFSEGELKNMVEDAGLQIEEVYYSKKGKRTGWIAGYNLCLIAKKC